MKMQTLQDSIQRMVIFDTNCDMNNKYDTKGFQSLVDALDKDAYLAWVKLDMFDTAGKYTFAEKDEIWDLTKWSQEDEKLYKMNP